MTMTEEINRRIELKRQLINLTEKEIEDLEEQLPSSHIFGSCNSKQLEAAP
jgi:hypothetical protein